MEEKGVWRTVGGRRIFIKEGQSLSDAMKSSKKFDDNNIKEKVKKQFDRKKEYKQYDEIREKGKELNKEVVRIVDKDGNILDERIGSYNGVRSTVESNKILMGTEHKNLSIIHNHPENSSFSFDDVANAQSNTRIDSIGVAAHDGTNYTLKFNNNRVEKSTFLKQYNEADIEYKKVLTTSDKYSFKNYQEAIKNNTIEEFRKNKLLDKSKMDAENTKYGNLVWEKIARENNWEYIIDE